jgi:bacterial/archaeal transporter family-2 protein
VRQPFAIAAAVLSGVGMAVQARLNGGLGGALGDGIASALISTGSGLLLLSAIVVSSPAMRAALHRIRAALPSRRLRWWHCLGGFGGAVYVASQGASVGSLGVGVFTVAVVGGTTSGSLAVDRAGLGPGGRRAITPPRLIGAAACVVAVALAGHDRLDDSSSLALLGLPVLAGLAVAVQSALNARVGAVAASPWAATLTNFAVAGATLCIAWPIEILLRGGPAGSLPHHPLLYCGGVIGVGVIAIAVTTVRRIGVLVFGLASVSGQLLGAILLDALGAHQPPWTTLLAVAITFGAVVLAVRPNR